MRIVNYYLVSLQTGMCVCFGATSFLHSPYHEPGADFKQISFNSRHIKQYSFLHRGQITNLQRSMCSTTLPQVGHARRIGTCFPFRVCMGESRTEGNSGCLQSGSPHFTFDFDGPDHSFMHFQQNSYSRPLLYICANLAFHPQIIAIYSLHNGLASWTLPHIKILLHGILRHS